MTKSKVMLLFIVVICLLSFSAYQFWNNAFPSSKEQDQIEELKKEQAEKVKKVYEEIEEKETESTGEGITTTEQAEAEFPMDMSENLVQESIHAMSHQKVKADQKRGAIQITPERIERLLVVVEANKETYEREDAYINILLAWKNGDFSQADLHHNTVWVFQEGEVGQAYGIMTTEEEQQYIDETFK